MNEKWPWRSGNASWDFMTVLCAGWKQLWAPMRVLGANGRWTSSEPFAAWGRALLTLNIVRRMSHVSKTSWTGACAGQPGGLQWRFRSTPSSCNEEERGSGWSPSLRAPLSYGSGLSGFVLLYTCPALAVPWSSRLKSHHPEAWAKVQSDVIRKAAAYCVRMALRHPTGSKSPDCSLGRAI